MTDIETDNSTRAQPKRARVLLVAYSCHPTASMESRVGWNRAIQVSRRHETWVLCSGATKIKELDALARKAGAGAGLRFIHVSNAPWAQKCCDSDSPLFWLGYRVWQRRAFQSAQALHKQHNFAIIHQVNFCGYREPGYGWKLGIPFVIGPVGGTQYYPWQYLSANDFRGGVREMLRNVTNMWQMRMTRHVRHAFQNASAVITANSTSERHLLNTMGVRSSVQLETGVNCLHPTPKEAARKEGPLRILWTGRFRTWKGLPLLLKAIATLPADCPIELRVLGFGPREESWRKQANSLGIADSVKWVGWPSYPDSFEHYEWADVFAFTSLRDTSGGGLLEALAAGVPIVGVDHQGAADIMTDDCAIRIPVTGPQATIAAFRNALADLARQPAQLETLSRGALERADFYDWDRLGDRLEEVYQNVLGRIGDASLVSAGNSHQSNSHQSNRHQKSSAGYGPNEGVEPFSRVEKLISAKEASVVDV